MPGSFPPRHRTSGPGATAPTPWWRQAMGAVWSLALLVSGCGGSRGDCLLRYADVDGDGFGDRSVQVEDCDSAGVLDGTDCDDGDPDVFPGQLERCNGLDDDCNDVVDDVLDSERTLQEPRFLDADGDGYGTGTAWTGCGEPPPLYTAANGLDCDDAAPARFPGAEERCNGVDDNCDGVVDVDAVDQIAFYLDGDGDGYGQSGTEQRACSVDDLPASPEPFYGGEYGAQATWVTRGGDCADTRPNIHPGAPEACNDIDDDCDGRIDEDPELLKIGWLDRDGDGWGGEPIESCDVDVFVVDPDDGEAVYLSSRGGDCNDADALVGPQALELCNGIDDDCDRAIDDADADRTTSGQLPWYLDRDGDGFGDPATLTWSCARPEPTATRDGSDCDDDDDQRNVDADEVCNGVDDDCDGHIDTLDASLVGGPCP